MQPIQWGITPLATANTARDGTGTVLEIFEAETDTYIQKVVFQPLGTNVATAGRVFVNNGQPTTVARNNALQGEVTLGATTASEVAAVAAVELALGRVIKAGHKLTVTIGTSVSAGFHVTAVPVDPADLV